MACIYAIRNKTNGKMYIGQTWDLEKRKYQHLWMKSKEKTALKSAVKKYGPDNFTWEVLCDGIEDQNTLDLAEQYFIWLFHTVGKNGYNMKHGGANGKHSEASRRAIVAGCSRRGETWKKNVIAALKSRPRELIEYIGTLQSNRSEKWVENLKTGQKNRWRRTFLERIKNGNVNPESKLGFNGIHFDNKREKYVAQLVVVGKKYRKRFDTLLDANEALLEELSSMVSSIESQA